MLALESAADPQPRRKPYPFDVLGAQTQGMIGYWLLQALQNALPGRQVAALSPRPWSSAADPAFANPTKFVGPVYDEATAQRLAAARLGRRSRTATTGAGSSRRREPQRIVETRADPAAAGAGRRRRSAPAAAAVPVVRDEAGELRGVEAVVDKDLTAEVLAERSRRTRCCC